MSRAKQLTERLNKVKLNEANAYTGKEMVSVTQNSETKKLAELIFKNYKEIQSYVGKSVPTKLEDGTIVGKSDDWNETYKVLEITGTYFAWGKRLKENYEINVLIPSGIVYKSSIIESHIKALK